MNADGGPSTINAEYRVRSLEDPGYLGMLLTTSADMDLGWKKEVGLSSAKLNST